MTRRLKILHLSHDWLNLDSSKGLAALAACSLGSTLVAAFLLLRSFFAHVAPCCALSFTFQLRKQQAKLRYTLTDCKAAHSVDDCPGMVVLDAELCLLAPPDDEEEERRAQRASKLLDPVEHLEQWRVICIDFHRFRAKCPDKCKELIRQGIPEFLRGSVWQKLALSRELLHKHPKDIYEQMRRVQTAPCEGDIVRDINRTFPKHVLYRDKQGLGQQQLLNVLRAYSIFNAEVGYCQGMGFICGVLLMYMGEDDAFLMLISLLENYRMAGLFMPNLPLLNKYFFQLQRLLEINLPLLHEHLTEQGVEPTMYASQWFMTVCIYNFPFSTVVRVWDIFLAEGVKIIFRIALALLKLNQEALLHQSFEQILQTLKQAPSAVESEVLIKTALNIKLKNKTLKDIESEWLSQMSPGL
ncbi:unnamed protein product [Durusdinium trenchii]|uniref:Rab-GAP TBC domain-containing protein n=2 Tax=Durusdinium trenchii TaxID=1381693 RepID=A0ABP0IWA8_9DINO